MSSNTYTMYTTVDVICLSDVSCSNPFANFRSIGCAMAQLQIAAFDLTESREKARCQRGDRNPSLIVYLFHWRNMYICMALMELIPLKLGWSLVGIFVF